MQGCSHRPTPPLWRPWISLGVLRHQHHSTSGRCSSWPTWSGNPLPRNAWGALRGQRRPHSCNVPRTAGPCRATGGRHCGVDQTLQVHPPSPHELLIPALGIPRLRAHHPNSPPQVVGGGQPRGKSPLRLITLEPAGQLGIRLHPAPQVAGETHQCSSSTITSLTREGLLVVHLPKNQQRHARLPRVLLSRNQVPMVPHPVHQPNVGPSHQLPGPQHGGRRTARLPARLISRHPHPTVAEAVDSKTPSPSGCTAAWAGQTRPRG